MKVILTILLQHLIPSNQNTCTGWSTCYKRFSLFKKVAIVLLNPSQTHPIAKFLRIIDVTAILSKRQSLKTPLFIKQNLSAKEMQLDLNKRWKLIQVRHNYGSVKIRNGSMENHLVILMKSASCRYYTLQLTQSYHWVRATSQQPLCWDMDTLIVLTMTWILMDLKLL